MRGQRDQTLTHLFIDGLACFRMVKLVRDDLITEPLRRAVVEHQGPPDSSKVSYLLHCPWCLSVYFGAALTLGRRRWPRATDAAARALALSALTGLGTQHLDRS
jgi:hypothetical protein